MIVGFAQKRSIYIGGSLDWTTQNHSYRHYFDDQLGLLHGLKPPHVV